MGNKTHPKCLRLGIVADWDCNWFAQNNYSELVYQDFLIRRKIKENLSRAGIAKVIINRKSGILNVIVYVARAGVIFGKNSIDLNVIKEEISALVAKNTKVNISILDEKNPEGNALLLAEWIAAQLEKRMAFRRAMKMAIQKGLKAGVEGIKVETAGRLAGAEIARTEKYHEGKVPLHTLRADIQYAFTEALTTYGKIGVKVWVYKGEIINHRKTEES